MPAELIPSAMLTVSLTPDVDAENALRTVVLEFMDDVRTAERVIAARRNGELDAVPSGVIGADEWQSAWPTEPSDEQTPEESVGQADPIG